MPQTELIVVSAADKRIRQLGEAMFELNARGECTRDLLRAEGFSTHELDTYGDAARAHADSLFVRDEAAEGFTKSDDEVVELAVQAGMGLLGKQRIFSAMQSTGLTPRQIERNWTTIVRKLGIAIGTLGAPQGAS